MSDTAVVDLGGFPDDEDPTKVLIRRYLAYLVDFLLLLALGIGVLAATAESSTIDQLNDRRQAEAGEGTEVEPLSLDDFKAFESDETSNGKTIITVSTEGFPVMKDRIIIIEQVDLQYVFIAVAAGWVLMFVGLQGFTGATIGKGAAGLRAVKKNGEAPGIVRALGRSILLPIDALPSAPFLPLVGTISAVATSGHKRLGDFLGGTYVVDKDAKGVPVHIPGKDAEAAPVLPPEEPAAPADDVPPWPSGADVGTAPQLDPQPEPTGQVPAWAAAAGTPAPTEQIDWTSEQPVPTGTGDDPWNPSAAGAGTAQSDWDAAIAAEEAAAEPAPTADPAAAAAAAATAAAAGTDASGDGPTIDDYEPQWDDARGSYIQWDPRRDEWLQFSETLKVWHPIDQPPSS